MGAPAGQRRREARVSDVSNRPGDRGGGRLDRPQVYRNRDDGQGSVQQFLLAKVCKVHVSRRGRLTVRWRQMQSTESFQGCRSSGTPCGRSSPCRFATTSQVATVTTLSIIARKTYTLRICRYYVPLVVRGEHGIMPFLGSAALFATTDHVATMDAMQWVDDPGKRGRRKRARRILAVDIA